jgi:hypothetical protein
MQFKNLEEALQFLRARGKRVEECDARCEIHCGGYRPDALAYDEFNRLVAVVVDNSKVEMTGRVDALREFAELDSRITFIVIEPANRVRFDVEVDIHAPEVSGDLTYETGRMFRVKDEEINLETDEHIAFPEEEDDDHIAFSDES